MKKWLPYLAISTVLGSIGIVLLTGMLHDLTPTQWVGIVFIAAGGAVNWEGARKQ